MEKYKILNSVKQGTANIVCHRKLSWNSVGFYQLVVLVVMSHTSKEMEQRETKKKNTTKMPNMLKYIISTVSWKPPGGLEPPHRVEAAKLLTAFWHRVQKGFKDGVQKGKKGASFRVKRQVRNVFVIDNSNTLHLLHRGMERLANRRIASWPSSFNKRWMLKDHSKNQSFLAPHTSLHLFLRIHPHPPYFGCEQKLMPFLFVPLSPVFHPGVVWGFGSPLTSPALAA